MSFPSITVFAVLISMLPLLTARATPAGTPVHDPSGCFGNGQARLDRPAGPFDGFFEADADGDADGDADAEADGCAEDGDGVGAGGSIIVARGAPRPPFVRTIATVPLASTSATPANRSTQANRRFRPDSRPTARDGELSGRSGRKATPPATDNNSAA